MTLIWLVLAAIACWRGKRCGGGIFAQANWKEEPARLHPRG
ncbi:hypothetical protein [Oscillatoria acuminata]|nr:hypothetical protein [Oscillatoria acuminata]